MGMYDQILALEWIRDNIGAFGGDPSLITLFGESAGGGSISAHLLSPLSRHLFKRGILQSGTINAPWSYMAGETARRISLDLINDVGCDASLVGTDTAKVMRCMRQVDGSTLSTAQWKYYYGILGFPFTITVDGLFLPKHPVELLSEGNFTNNIDILIGSNQDEGRLIPSTCFALLLCRPILSIFGPLTVNCISFNIHQLLSCSCAA